MSKRLLMKKFLTLDEAAQALNSQLAESITTTDLLQHALDGDLVLSINLHQPELARPVTLTPVEHQAGQPTVNTQLEKMDFMAELNNEDSPSHQLLKNRPDALYAEIPTLDGEKLMSALPGYEVKPHDFCFDSIQHIGSLLQWEEVTGLLDLPLISTEKAAVQNFYLSAIGEAPLPLPDAPILVNKPGSRSYYQLFSIDDSSLPFAHHPICNLEHFGKLLVRPDNLLELVKNIKSLDFEILPSHYRLIGALLEVSLDLLNKEGLNYNQTRLVNEITSRYEGVHGLRSTTINKILGEANKQIKNLR